MRVRNHLVLGAVGALFLCSALYAVTSGLRISQQGSFLQSGTGAQLVTLETGERRLVSCKEWLCVGDGMTDDTTALQNFLNSGKQNLFIPDGTYRITSQLTQTPGTTVTFGGGAYLQPDASVWASSYVWQIYDNWNNPTGDFINGQYLRGNRTALYGFRSFPSAPIAATTLLGTDGIGIVVQDLRSWGAKNGCIEIRAGAEWRLNGSQCIAPPERSATAKGLSDAAADGLIDGFVSEAYPYGMYFTSTSSNNDVFNAHVWGQPAANSNPAWVALTAYTTNMYVSNGGNTYRCTTAGTSASSGGPTTTATSISDGSVVWTYVATGTGLATRALNWGFWFDGGGANAGGSNRCWGCIADTPERINTGAVASTSNGGLGFYIENWSNSITGAYVIGSVALSKAFVINNAQGNSIIGSSAPFNAAQFETGGYVVFQGTATANNNTVLAGSFNRDAQIKTGPFWWDPANGNMFWGSAAASPGFDNNVGTAVYNNGNVGSTRDGEILSLNRPSTDGIAINVYKNTSSVLKIGTQSRGTCTLNGGSPSTCTATVLSGQQCTANPTGTTATAATHTVATSVSSTTLTVTGANGLTDVVAYHCF